MSYDPRAHTIKLPGRSSRNGPPSPPVDYLPVAQRVRWFRETHPDGQIESTVIEITEERAIFQVRVSVPGGGSATSTGNETRAGFADYIGKAETVALGRALAILGFGIDFADEFDEAREQADPRDYEINQANPVRETAQGQFDPRNRNGQGKPVTPAPKPAATTPKPSGRATKEQLEAILRLSMAQGADKAAVRQVCVDLFGHGPEQLTATEAGEWLENLQQQGANAAPVEA